LGIAAEDRFSKADDTGRQKIRRNMPLEAGVLCPSSERKTNFRLLLTIKLPRTLPRILNLHGSIIKIL
jgi:hypothetical protein